MDSGGDEHWERYIEAMGKATMSANCAPEAPASLMARPLEKLEEMAMAEEVEEADAVALPQADSGMEAESRPPEKAKVWKQLRAAAARTENAIRTQATPFSAEKQAWPHCMDRAKELQLSGAERAEEPPVAPVLGSGGTQGEWIYTPPPASTDMQAPPLETPQAFQPKGWHLSAPGAATRKSFIEAFSSEEKQVVPDAGPDVLKSQSPRDRKEPVRHVEEVGVEGLGAEAVETSVSASSGSAVATELTETSGSEAVNTSDTVVRLEPPSASASAPAWCPDSGHDAAQSHQTLDNHGLQFNIPSNIPHIDDEDDTLAEHLLRDVRDRRARDSANAVKSMEEVQSCVDRFARACADKEACSPRPQGAAASAASADRATLPEEELPQGERSIIETANFPGPPEIEDEEKEEDDANPRPALSSPIARRLVFDKGADKSEAGRESAAALGSDLETEQGEVAHRHATPATDLSRALDSAEVLVVQSSKLGTLEARERAAAEIVAAERSALTMTHEALRECSYCGGTCTMQ